MAGFKLESTINRIQKKLKKDLTYNKTDAVLADVAALAEIYYEWNQFYCDEALETICENAGKDLLVGQVHSWTNEDNRNKTILYCDTFGNDIRGLSLMYLKALVDLDYKVIYVTRIDRREDQPILRNTLIDKNIVFEYIDFASKYTEQVNAINAVVQQYKPDIAFLYTKPYDVAVVAVFSQYEGILERYKINLTDHAFWLGKVALDYCIEFRDYGASVSFYKRGIKQEKIVALPYYPYVDQNISFEGDLFDEGTRYVFSGGSLYKTLGEENKYYKIVEHILQTDDKICFLYAGSGDDSQLKKIAEKYPDRVVHIPERKDFVELIRRSVFYLNTYPTVGGQMMQYCALVGKLPVTLRHNLASGGLLLNQKKAAIEFDSLEEIYAEIDKLLSDDKYLHERENSLNGCVITEREFQEALGQMLKYHETPYKLDYIQLDLNEIAREYRFRINEAAVVAAIAKKRHISLFAQFPIYFLKRYLKLR